jgi:hypothetical protein
MPNDDVEEILAEAVRAYRRLPGKIRVSDAIEAVTGQKVIPLASDEEDKNLLRRISQAASLLIERSAGDFIRTSRLNELGNAIEEPLLRACCDVGLNATWPSRRDGSGGRTGYPDIAIDIRGDRPTYLEAKVIGAGSEGSSFRSFYLSPSENPKVCVDARHLLVAFVHKRRGSGDDGLERYSLISYKIVDMARVVGKIKFEYQSSNKDMYLGGSVIARG